MLDFTCVEGMNSRLYARDDVRKRPEI